MQTAYYTGRASGIHSAYSGSKTACNTLVRSLDMAHPTPGSNDWLNQVRKKSSTLIDLSLTPITSVEKAFRQ